MAMAAQDLQLRLLAAFVARELSYEALADLVSAGLAKRVSSSTCWRALNAQTGTRGETLLRIAEVLDVSPTARGVAGVGEREVPYHRGMMERLLRAAIKTKRLPKLVQFTERLAGLPKRDRDAILRLLTAQGQGKGGEGT